LSLCSPVCKYQSISSVDRRRKCTRERLKLDRMRRGLQSIRQMPDRTSCQRPLRRCSIERASARVCGFLRMLFPRTTMVSTPMTNPEACRAATSAAFMHAIRTAYAEVDSRAFRAGSDIRLGSTRNCRPSRFRILRLRGEAEPRIHSGLFVFLRFIRHGEHGKTRRTRKIPCSPCFLKRVTQHHLHSSRVALCGGYGSEIGIIQVRNRIRKTRAVENVEGLKPEL